MSRRIILFGAFLSAFILILIPSIDCVYANIQNENNLDIKNINIDDIKTIINRLNDSDCNCQKTANYNNDKSWSPFFLCKILNVIFDYIFLLAIKTSYYNKIITRILIGILETMVGLAIIFNCDLHPNFPKLNF